MTQEELQSKTNAELVEMVKTQGLTVDAKNPAKPVKAELIKAIVDNTADEVDELTAIMEAEDNANAQAALKDAELEVIKEREPTAPVPKKMTRAQLKKKQFADKMKYCRVMATSNRSSETKTDLVTISWGNGLLGYHTDRVMLGKPWHVRQGALDNMNGSTVIIQVPKYTDTGASNGVERTTIPAYNIVDLGLLTQEEYSKMAEKQQIRNAAADAQ